MQKQIILLLGITLAVSGCSTATHVNELLTLKRMGEEQAENQKIIAAQDENFEKMLNDYQTEDWGKITTKKGFIKEYGNPVIWKKEIVDDKHVDVWLYRYATQYFDSSKIYLYFDEKNKLINSEFVDAPIKE